ncbi:MAG: exosortase N [Bacteroidia bacterium]|nr:exosortase N [Bacteroidia bacterium]
MQKSLTTFGLVAWVLLAGIQNLREYIPLEMNVVLCFMLAPFVMRIQREGEYSVRYGWLAAGSLLAFHLIHMQIFFLLGVGATIFMILEARHGKMGILPLILLILISPMLQFLVRIFTFPIRLEMSRISGEILRSAGYEVTVNGNIFETGPFRFAIDQACLGLNMIITGLIITTLLITFAERRTGLTTPVWKLAALYVTTIILLLLSNFSRILVIVIFKSPPETLSHELIGLACLILYVVVPLFFLTQRLNTATTPRPSKPGKSYTPVLGLALFPPLVVAVFLLNLNRENYRYEPVDAKLLALEIPGMEKKMLETGLAKFQNENLLLYIKPPCRFWRSDHTPSICWQASGYETEHIRTLKIGENEVFVAELQKEEETLYTAWWYDNGTHKTMSQFDWRWKTLKGDKPFSLINLTAADEVTLQAYCQQFLETPTIFSENNFNSK